jgi:hypothetical protein
MTANAATSMPAPASAPRVEHLGWQSVQFLNVPVGLPVLATAQRVRGESRSVEPGRLDDFGAATFTAGLQASVHAFVTATQDGWPPPTVHSTAQRPA